MHTTQSTHTKGPWRVTAAKRAVSDSRGWDICTLPNGQGPVTKDESSANARLIAAAPELLEALRDARDVTEAHFQDLSEQERDIPAMRQAMGLLIVRLDAAITKAEGKG